MLNYIAILIALISFSCVPSHDWIVEATKKKVHDKEAITTWIMTNTSACNRTGTYYNLQELVRRDFGKEYQYYNHRIFEAFSGKEKGYVLEIVCNNSKNQYITFIYEYNDKSSEWCYIYTTDVNLIDNRPQNY